MVNPCKNCENKGCGTFHDECEPYQNYLQEKEIINKKRVADKSYYAFKKEVVGAAMRKKSKSSR